MDIVQVLDSEGGGGGHRDDDGDGKCGQVSSIKLVKSTRKLGHLKKVNYIFLCK